MAEDILPAAVASLKSTGKPGRKGANRSAASLCEEFKRLDAECDRLSDRIQSLKRFNNVPVEPCLKTHFQWGGEQMSANLATEIALSLRARAMNSAEKHGLVAHAEYIEKSMKERTEAIEKRRIEFGLPLMEARLETKRARMDAIRDQIIAAEATEPADIAAKLEIALACSDSDDVGPVTFALSSGLTALRQMVKRAAQ